MSFAQYDLFAPTLDQRFEAWIGTPNGRDVQAAVTAAALDLLAAGVPRRGIKAVVEDLRWNPRFRPADGEPFKLDNRFVSRLARRIEQDEPRLVGFFPCKSLQSPDRRPSRAVVVPIRRSA